MTVKIVRVDGKKVAIHHQFVPDEDGLMITHCKIVKGDRVIARSVAYQSKADKHCEKTAAKITLARAIGSDHKPREWWDRDFNVDQRKQIWNQFLSADK